MTRTKCGIIVESDGKGRLRQVTKCQGLLLCKCPVYPLDDDHEDDTYFFQRQLEQLRMDPGAILASDPSAVFVELNVDIMLDESDEWNGPSFRGGELISSGGIVATSGSPLAQSLRNITASTDLDDPRVLVSLICEELIAAPI